MVAINLVEKLQHSQVFSNVPVEDLEALIEVMERREYAAGQVIFERGDEGDSLYEIIEGKIRIYTENAEGQSITLVERGPGEVVGELTLLDHQPRSASAMAAEDLKVLILDREHFLSFLKDRPSVGLQLMLTLTGRIRYTTTYLQRVVDWINRVNEGDFESAMKDIKSSADDGDMQRLISTFIEMIAKVQDRHQQNKGTTTE